MAYSTGPYAQFTSLPAPPRPEIHSSREIDFRYRKYVLDATTGGNGGMRSTAQRVVLLAALSYDEPQFNTAEGRNKIANDIRGALRIMTNKPEPQIVLKKVEVARDRPELQFTEIEFVDLTSGLSQTVQLP